MLLESRTIPLKANDILLLSSVCHIISLQGSVTTRRNRFLPGRMEESGKRYFFQFLLEESGNNWKEAEETGWNTCSQMCMHGTKMLKRSSQILWSKLLAHQCRSYFSKFWNFARFHWLVVQYLHIYFMSDLCMFQWLHIQATLWLHNQRYNVNFHQS